MKHEKGNLAQVCSLTQGTPASGNIAPEVELSLLDGSELAQFEDKEGSDVAVVYFVARAIFSRPPVNFTAEDVHVDDGRLATLSQIMSPEVAHVLTVKHQTIGRLCWFLYPSLMASLLRLCLPICKPTSQGLSLWMTLYLYDAGSILDILPEAACGHYLIKGYVQQQAAAGTSSTAAALSISAGVLQDCMGNAFPAASMLGSVPNRQASCCLANRSCTPLPHWTFLLRNSSKK
jgi:hypothetical protein